MSRRAKLAGADLALALDALDMAIELLETVWSKDPKNTRQDAREIKANIARMWRLVARLVTYAPDHPMAWTCKKPRAAARKAESTHSKPK